MKRKGPHVERLLRPFHGTMSVWRIFRNNLCRSVTLGIVGSSIVGCALVQTEAERGHYVAEKWCSECHRVAPDEPSGMRVGHVLPPPVAAPSFMVIAARPDTTAGSLDHFLAELHLPMPTYRLREDERREVVAYILSLAPSSAR